MQAHSDWRTATYGYRERSAERRAESAYKAAEEWRSVQSDSEAAMVTRTSNYRIEDLLGSPRHGAPFCCDKTPSGGAAFASGSHLDLQKAHAAAPPGLVNPVPVRLHRGPSASGQSGSRAGPQNDLPLHQIAQLLALAQQSKDQRLTLDDVAESAHLHSAAQFAQPQPTAFQPVTSACCNVLPQSSNVDPLLHYGHAAHALSPVVQPHNAAQFTPIPWFIYQQMALRQAYQSAGSPGVLASIHNPATYFFAAQAHYRKPKRIRTAFSPSQLLRLEAAFDKNPYVVGQERKELAASLNLRETQVKVWFQNRRTKKKRMKLEDFESQFEDGETVEDATRPPSSLSISSKDSTSCNSPTNSPVKA